MQGHLFYLLIATIKGLKVGEQVRQGFSCMTSFSCTWWCAWCWLRECKCWSNTFKGYSLLGRKGLLVPNSWSSLWRQTSAWQQLFCPFPYFFTYCHLSWAHIQVACLTFVYVPLLFTYLISHYVFHFSLSDKIFSDVKFLHIFL